jgi:hypothetical protein
MYGLAGFKVLAITDHVVARHARGMRVLLADAAAVTRCASGREA